MSGTRPASHAGSWYSDDKEDLDKELDEYLSRVPSVIEGAGEIPPEGARVIIAPHAGYSYSGPAAAWAYKSLNLKNIKRVFILGPSHHVYLNGLAVTSHETYATPLGALPIDTVTTSHLRSLPDFSVMSPRTDSDEHSIEMHLPYTHKTLLNHFGSQSAIPPVVPLLVGSISTADEKKYGEILADYLDDPENAFIVSSDFCHWGSRFSYQYYTPSPLPDTQPISLSKTSLPKSGQPIYQAIEQLDKLAISAIESGKHDVFAEYLRRTKNTVCGRHPIGVVMAALEVVVKRRKERGEQGVVDGVTGVFKFVRYEQSSRCLSARDSSVSYASAFAVL